MNKNYIILLAVLVLIIALLSTKCSSNRSDDFDFATQTMIDTIVRNEKKLIDLEMDSICILKMDSLVSLAIDSIKEERLKEILFILNKENEIQ